MRRVACLVIVTATVPVGGAFAAARPAPVVHVSARTGAVPLVVRFGVAAGRDAVRWRFGDGATAAGPHVAHRFVAPGRYRVRVSMLGEPARTATVEVRALAVRAGLTRARVPYGESVAVRGRVVPAQPRALVLLERGRSPLARTHTGAGGRFEISLRPGRGGPLRVRLAGTGVRSQPLDLTLVPRLQTLPVGGSAFQPVRVRARVVPASAGGRASVSVLAGGRELRRVEVPVRGGVVAARVPLAAVGPLVVRVRLAARPGQAAVEASVRVQATVHALAPGARGADVLALRARLAELGFHVPGPDTTFGPQLADAVIAFQKARGLARTGRVGETVWRALALDSPPRPRYTTPSPHIEIDKARQLLLVVENARLAGALPVSSGATGNTPVGSFSILWKAPATSTWLGSAILYRTMTFYRNFAIHGYYSVPAYPASHGCVRVPVWAADWLYDRSHVGERVFVY